jgi:sortase A
MRRALRICGTVLLGAGLLAIAWALTVWQWQDPFTALYTRHQQRALESRFDERYVAYRAPKFHPKTPRHHDVIADEKRQIARLARRYQHQLKIGDPVGRLRVPRLGLNIILVNGTDHASLAKGPGRDPRTYVPGEGQLVYIAGHRTTYLAPFAEIQSMRRGDFVSIQVPYGKFVYRVRGSVVVPADDVSRLQSHGREVIVLQACHPRFFATHRYLVYAVPVRVFPRGGVPYKVGPTFRAQEPSDS